MKVGTKGAALALLLAACGLSTGPGDPRDAQEIELRAGEERAIPGTVLRVAFVRITEDSRCPIGVVCVWEGNAAVELGVTAGTGPTHQIVLNTALEPQAVDFGGMRLTLVSVTPVPREDTPIPPESYVVRLRVEPIEP